MQTVEPSRTLTRLIGFSIGLCLALAPTHSPALTAVWTGPSGSYSDPTAWTIDPATPGVSVPDNDSEHQFDIVIGGDLSRQEVVLVDDDPAINRLRINAEDRLEISPDRTFSVEPPRTGARRDVVNNGTLLLREDATLLLANHTQLFGTGVLDLGSEINSTLHLNAVTNFRTLLNGPSHTLRGSGTIHLGEQSGTLENQGRLEAGTQLIIDGSIDNEGEVYIGQGASLQLRGPSRRLYAGTGGRTTIEGGGVLDVSSYLPDGDLLLQGVGSTLRASHGLVFRGETILLDNAEVISTQMSSEANLLYLDESIALETFSFDMRTGSRTYLEENASITTRGVLTISGRVEGNGRLATIEPARFPRTELRHADAVLAPGRGDGDVVDRIGKIDIGGRFDLRAGTFDFEVLNESLHDRVDVSGRLSILDQAVIRVSAIDTTANLLGVPLTLTDAAEIQAPSTQSIDQIIQGSGLNEGQSWIGSIEQTLEGESLVVRVKERINAVWNAGSGLFSDGSGWQLSKIGPANQETYPNQDDSRLFHAAIEGVPGAESRVTLDQSVSLESLAVAAGASLEFAPGTTLELTGREDRLGSSQIFNDGSIALGSSEGGGTLDFETDSRFEGMGLLRLDADARITRGGDGRGRIAVLENGNGHTIAGIGEIDLTLHNSGTLLADRVGTLRVNDLQQNDGLISVTGDGHLYLPTRNSDTRNDGRIEISNGGRMTSLSDIANFGEIAVDGMASTFEAIDGVSNFDGSIAVLDGGFLDISSGGFDQSGDSAALFVDENSLMRAGSGRLLGGIARIDGEFDGDLVVRFNGRLAGAGSIIGDVNFFNDGILDPGTNGSGQLDISRELQLNRTQLRFDIDAAGSDRVVAAGGIRFRSASEMEISLADGFTPVRGSSYSLLEAPEILFAGQLSRFAGQALGDERYLVPELKDTESRDEILVHAVESVQADWTGGSGSFNDANRWQFDSLALADFVGSPNNDETSLFHVSIESDPSDPTLVRVLDDARIESLVLGDRTEVSIDAGAALTIAGAPYRPKSGRIDNHGNIIVGSDGAVVLEDNTALTGSGTLALTDSSSLLGLRPTDTFTVDFTNGTGHTIRGAGTVRLTDSGAVPFSEGLFIQNGHLIADGDDVLEVFSRGTENNGRIDALGTGGVRISLSVLNRGEIYVAPGSSFSGANIGCCGDDFRNEGIVRVDGFMNTGSHLITGRTTVGSDGFLSGGFVGIPSPLPGRVGKSDSAHFIVEQSGSVRANTILLEDGRTEFHEANLSVSGLRIEGDAYVGGSAIARRISPNSNRPTFNMLGGILDIGFDGIGTIDFDGRGFFSDGEIRFDVRSYDEGDFDRLVLRDNSFNPFLGEGVVRVRPSDKFEIELGRFVPLIESDWRNSLQSPGSPLEQAITFDAHPGEDVFFVPDKRRNADRFEVGFRAKKLIRALWAKADGLFSEAQGWLDDQGKPVGFAATLSDTNLFEVTVRSDSNVRLESQSRVDRLELDRRASLTVSNVGLLQIEGAEDRSGSNFVANDGSIRLEGDSTTNQIGSLVFAAGSTFGGSGEIVLDGGEIRGREGESFDFINPYGHTIRGVGAISTAPPPTGFRPPAPPTMLNRGRIIAEPGESGPAALTIRTSLENQGHIDIAPNGVLALDGSLVNSSTVNIERDGRIEAPLIENHGQFKLQGAEATVDLFRSTTTSGLTDVFRNSGLVVIADDAKFFGGQFFQIDDDTALTRVDHASINLNGGSQNQLHISAGRFDLIEGELNGVGKLIVKDRGFMTASGRIDTVTAQVGTGGRLAIGTAGPASLEIDGEFELQAGGLLELDIVMAPSTAKSDILSVLGTSVLAGLISVSIDGTHDAKGSPARRIERGDHFDLMIAARILDEGYSVNVAYAVDEFKSSDLSFATRIDRRATGDVLTLVAVPEPGTGTLLGMGLLLLAIQLRLTQPRL